MKSSKLQDYLALIRFDKPIGTLLVLWPTLWALWLASEGWPGWPLFLIFSLGCFLMRSAGCAINDYADRDFDKHVRRTAERPVTAGRIAPWEALVVTGILALCAFILIWPLNNLTKALSVPALVVAIIYPFTKRFFSIPQAILGIAFSFGIPMAYAAIQNYLPAYIWLLVLANIAWAIAYDTAYAMVDREDDLKIGIRTSAITFGRWDVCMIALCYAIAVILLGSVGYQLQLKLYFWLGLVLAAILAIYFVWRIRKRHPQDCFTVFRQNNWFGACIFLAIALGL